MEIMLPPDLESYVDRSVRRGAFSSASELIQEAVRRKMEEDAWMEEKVLEAEDSELSPLTREDLKSVRDLIRQPRATRAS
jgi:Predicted transcriptional regulators containing the CopG/Arc/MetJ DNA-binding domain and a metal-binding domain